jgi:endonuclease III
VTTSPDGPDETGLLREISYRLQQLHGTAPLGNKDDPLDELVFIQLSIRTREGAYNTAFERLRSACDGDWAKLGELPEQKVLSILGPGGMAAIKRQRLIDQLAMIVDAFGEASLEPLERMPTDAAERFLTSLPGVGPKTARCVLLYSLDRAVFPVDSHCLRTLDRLGYVPTGVDRKVAHDLIQDLVPRDIRHDLHVNLVHHGRTICVFGRPRCESCPVRELCPTGQNSSPR